MTRVQSVDIYIEGLFGEPDYTKTFWSEEHQCWLTPLKGKKVIWRAD